MFLAWLRALAPAQLAAGGRDAWLGTLGAGAALLLTEWLGRQLLGESSSWFIAPLGATAVLLFGLPASPLAQPWPVFGGSVMSAAIGVACCHWLGATPAVAAVAGAAATGAMFALRCLHPPAGAVAMTAVLGGPAIQQLGFGFAAWLVPAGAASLLLAAYVFNNLAGRRYPHRGAARPHPHATADPLPSARLLAKEDFDAAMASYGEVLDVGVDDLEEILVRAQLHAGRRRWGEVRCRDVMARDVVTVAPGTSLEAAWALLRRHAVQALPVVDGARRLVGIVSLHDFFLASAARLPQPRTAARVGDIMTRSVRVARPEGLLVDLVEAFSDGGLHHMPVLDADDRVLGMITQSDLVAGLFHAPPAAGGVPASVRGPTGASARRRAPQSA
ncbi:MAG: HPP family protein [Comamonadaceae bacterium]|nr:MAG: HPP family protein [Comamonadaceae bacterium]